MQTTDWEEGFSALTWDLYPKYIKTLLITNKDKHSLASSDIINHQGHGGKTTGR